MNEYFGPGEYLTRDGHKAVVLGVIPDPTEETYTLLGYIEEMDSSGRIINRMASWTTDGSYHYAGSPLRRYDLMPPLYEGWVNVYEGDTPAQIHPSLEEATVKARTHLIRTVYVREVNERS